MRSPPLRHSRLAVLYVLALLCHGSDWVRAADMNHDPATLLGEAETAFQRGRFERALIDWKEAARLYGTAGDTVHQGQALVSAAHAAQMMGETKQALQSLELALSLPRHPSDALWRAVVLGQLGRTYLLSRQLDAAQQYLTQALVPARDHDSGRVLAPIVNDLGILHALRSHHADAVAFFTESVDLAESTGQAGLAVRARINAARSTLKLNQPERSREWLDAALHRVQPLTTSEEHASALIAIGLGYQHLRPALPHHRDPLLLRAAGSLQEASALAERLGDARTLSYALGHLGHLYESERRFEEALGFTRRAVFAAQSVDAPESLYRWQWQLGRQLAALDRLDDAIAAYQQAVTTVQPIRQQLAAHADGWISDQDLVRPLFFELADQLLQRADRTIEPEASEHYLLAARDAIESYKAAELRDYFRDECVDALQARMTKSDTLAAGTAIIYPILFPTRLEILVSLPSGMRRFAVAVPAEDITQEIRKFRRMVEKRTTRQYLPHAQQLYNWLVRPIEKDLRHFNITTLVFVPDSALRTIPLAALHDGERFLIAHYAVALTPGITLTDPHPLNRDRIRFLATGLTRGVQGFPALPYVAEEMDSIRRLYASNQLLNQEFVAQQLEQELRDGQYGIVHIATHGEFSTDANKSFLLTFDGKLTMNQLDHLIGLYRFREQPIELLTLSACQTGVGDDRAALGLAGVAIKAGARSALATLWFINDEASAALIAEFYRQLRMPSLSKAQALQRAQLKLLDDRIYGHPAYWSAFLLLNNWL